MRIRLPLFPFMHLLSTRRFLSRQWEPGPATALVIVPHPDDEILGCGGTIMRKLQKGARIRLLFLTDGGSSHAPWIKSEKLKEMRKDEALQAARVLGVDINEVFFFNIPDNSLGGYIPIVKKKVIEHLEDLQPFEVFLPYGGDGCADHEAAHKLSFLSVKTWIASRRMVEIREYPVWFWNHWPWVSIDFSSKRRALKILYDSVKEGLGFKLFSHFNQSVALESIRKKKWTALNCYTSQMIRPEEHADWPVLGDVAGGDWLDCFFKEFEIFRYYQLGTTERKKNEGSM